MQHRLERGAWRARAQAHRERVAPWIEPRLRRRARGEKHPVDDFLFEYYQFRPAQLARWQPGPGVLLQAPAELPCFVEQGGWAALDRESVAPQRQRIPAIKALLAATADRPARLGCSALHEWAMVYRVPQEAVRHASWPLRLPPAAIAEVVESQGLRCTHFDAFRFFSPDAAPRNRHQLTRASQIGFEQPGCLHATMDLYKWAYRLSPLVPAELVADTFELARRARELDMRAAPYDLSALGVRPIAVETAEGRAELARLQRELAADGQALRARLLAAVATAEEWLAHRS